MSRSIMCTLSLSSSADAASEMNFRNDEYIGYATSYDRPYIYHITNKHILVFKIVDGIRMERTQQFDHNLTNLALEFVSTFCSHNFVIICKKYLMVIYEFNEEKSKILNTLHYPNSYFGIAQYTGKGNTNVWTDSLLMQTSEFEVHSINLNKLNSPIATRVALTTGSDPIVSVRVVDLGQAAALVYANSVQFYSLVSLKQIGGLNFEDEIQFANYEYGSNILILLMKNTNYSIAIDTNSKGNYTKKRFSIDYSSNQSQKRAMRIMKNYFILAEPTFLYICEAFNGALKERAKLKLPNEYFGYQFEMTYRYSNLVMIMKRDSESTNIRNLMITSDLKTEFCPGSCRGRCQYPFVVCSLKKFFIYGLTISFLAVGLFMYGQYIILQFSRKTLHKRDPMQYHRDQMLSKALSIAGEVKKTKQDKEFKVRFRPSKMTPQLMRAVKQELLDEDDEEDVKHNRDMNNISISHSNNSKDDADAQEDAKSLKSTHSKK